MRKSDLLQALLHKAGGHLARKQKNASFHTHSDATTHAPRTRGDIPDQQGRISGEGEAMSGAAIEDRVSGDLQRQLGLEVLIGQTVGALRPPVT